MTDVLVVGGGVAGSFAAVRAREQGADVVMVDKGFVSRSGSTPYPKNMMVFDPEGKGHQLGQWMDEVAVVGEYLNNRRWTEIVIRESGQVFTQLESWGVGFKQDGEGAVVSNWAVPGGIEAVQLEVDGLAPRLRRQVVQHGINVIDRVMLTELIVVEGRVLGAVGISTIDDVLHVFRAKATVLCTGAASFKPYGFPIASVTGDGMAMAYRAGAEIIGKEFYDTHLTSAEHPADVTYMSMDRPPGRMPGFGLFNADGARLDVPGPTTISAELEAHAGRSPVAVSGPPGSEPRAVVGGAALGYGGTGEGVWPVDAECASSVAGLYAAGESCGTFHLGAAYPGGGWGVPSAAVTGGRAGRGAARWAAGTDHAPVDDAAIAELVRAARAPSLRRGGFTPDWLTQTLRSTLAPYYMLGVKSGDRLEAGLTLIEFMRDHLVPKLRASDPHELRKAHETRNMVLNAEMKLRASLFRTESRGTHFREDFPLRDDPEWLCWVVLQAAEGQMAASRRPIPREWWPDLSVPYEKRYPFRFPGEGR